MTRAVPARGDDPPEPPASRRLGGDTPPAHPASPARASGPARGDDPPESPDRRFAPSGGKPPRHRDRDSSGRPRNARPRDELGRPLPPGAPGTDRIPDDLSLPPAESLALAQSLLDRGRAFHAHEVLEASWKQAPAAERELWRGLAQLAVGLTTHNAATGAAPPRCSAGARSGSAAMAPRRPMTSTPPD